MRLRPDENSNTSNTPNGFIRKLQNSEVRRSTKQQSYHRMISKMIVFVILGMVQEMEQAVKNQDFKRAAEIKKEIEDFTNSNGILLQ